MNYLHYGLTLGAIWDYRHKVHADKKYYKAKIVLINTIESRVTYTLIDYDSLGYTHTSSFKSFLKDYRFESVEDPYYVGSFWTPRYITNPESPIIYEIIAVHKDDILSNGSYSLRYRTYYGVERTPSEHNSTSYLWERYCLPLMNQEVKTSGVLL